MRRMKSCSPCFGAQARQAVSSYSQRKDMLIRSLNQRYSL